ncbi:red chlorophyll catabolite reductase chloroplastic [Phtheirospermum japonicum]|uniref:Red chlorophyll catabolite reductase chloroplastic n=1 Tax=Phtheirospermum japonicum TaxID=374723 RepID=A0A830DDS6_9LAMI|nr:red chlorophyll catabolite reductase chloroplastic [Phtheirospermum japonicum]
MAIISTSTSSSLSIFHCPRTSNSTPKSRCSKSRAQFPGSSSSASMDTNDELKAKFMEFPFVSGSHKKLMVELLSSVDSRLGSSLQSCTLPPDVQHFGNSTASARASLHLRSGLPSSQIDFILGGWIHCDLPSGGALNITSLSAYLKPSTNAPHFLLDLIQSSPTSLVLILDLTPRKDPISYPDYLKTYYEDTNLDRHRQRLQTLPVVKPYFSPSLYIRAVLSPTAILVGIDVGDDEETGVEDIIEHHVGPVAKEMLDFWIESCACLERSVGEDERDYLEERDGIIKRTTIEVDLGASFPRLFGQEVADRVLGVLKGYYGK